MKYARATIYQKFALEAIIGAAFRANKIPAAFAVVVCMNDPIQIPFDQSNANAAFAFVVVGTLSS
jgi:hypothetical protein